MRTVLIAAAALASAGTAQAAQRMVPPSSGMAPAPMGGPAAAFPAPIPGSPNIAPHSAGMRHGPGPNGARHWGGQYEGHWIGGMRAPGGWTQYRRPYRGYGLPAYWLSSGFRIGDWGDYGLYQPPVGYNWSRYYDDAVLLDNRGSVYDTVGGIDWNRYDLDEAQGGRIDAYAANADEYRATAGAGYAYPPQGGYAGQPGGYATHDGYSSERGGYPPSPRSNGVGGALIGGAAGGIAGGLIAGRHDKVGGALIGAGAGALAGYAIDRSVNRRPRDYPQYGPGAGYPAPGYGPRFGYPSQGMGYGRPPIIHTDGGTVVTTSTGDGYGNGYYSGGSVTTVTVSSTPIVTTTTEVFEDDVTYKRRAAHRAYRKHVWRRPVCYCR